jgi:branched-chain amino acid aminotransferase
MKKLMPEVIYINGSFFTPDKAVISVMDYGFLFGYSLFETMRAYTRKVFCLDEHMSRLCTSAEQLGIKIDPTILSRAVYDTIVANRVSNARVRLVVTLGEGSITPDPKSCSTPNIIVFAREYHPYPVAVYRKGWRVMVSSIRRNKNSELTDIKSSNYLENLLIKQEALKKGLDDAVILNNDGLVAEASSSNVFIVQDGILKTPTSNSGILPGITRAQVMKIATASGIPVQETQITLDELLRSSEVFLTNSMIELMPIVEINGQQIDNGWPGKITTLLSEKYRKKVSGI